MEWELFFSELSLNVGSQLNEKQLSLSGISNSLTESSKFHKMRTFPRQSKPSMLCSVNISKQRETGYEINIWSRHSDVKVFYTSCCFQLDIFLRKRIYVAINIPLLLSLPHSITGHHCCQSSLHVASGVDGTAKIWESETGVFNFLLFKSDTGTGKWKCFFPLKTDTGTGWLFQLAAKVSSKLAVILAIQLLGLKWEFKVNFMQI